MRTHLKRFSYVVIMGIIIIKMMLCCKLPVEGIPLGKPGKVGSQDRPPPPENPNHHADDGERHRPGPGAAGLCPLLVQVRGHPGVVGGRLRQLRHEVGHLLFQQLKRNFFTHWGCDVVVRKHLTVKWKQNSSSSKLDLCTQRSLITASSRCKSELLYHTLSGSPTRPRKV